MLLPPPSAPGGSPAGLNACETGSYIWNDKLTLEFLGSPRVASIDIEPVDVPTIYLIGDSALPRYQPGRMR